MAPKKPAKTKPEDTKALINKMIDETLDSGTSASVTTVIRSKIGEAIHDDDEFDSDPSSSDENAVEAFIAQLRNNDIDVSADDLENFFENDVVPPSLSQAFHSWAEVNCPEDHEHMFGNTEDTDGFFQSLGIEPETWMAVADFYLQ